MTLVCLHGWLGSKRSWASVTQQMEVTNTVVPTLPYNPHASASFTMDSLVEGFATFIDAEVGGPVVLAGHSMGGMLALRYAVEYEVAGLFLAGSCCSTPRPVRHSVSWFREALGEIPREEWAEAIVQNYCWEGTPDAVREGAFRQLMQADDVPILDGLAVMEGYDVRDALPVGCPVSLVAGRHDGAIPPAQSRELTHHLETDIEWLETGHDMLHEAPGDVSSLLENFYGSLHH